MTSAFSDAVVAGKIAGNKSMQEHGREVWQEEDIAAAHRAFSELWDVKLNRPRCTTVAKTPRRVGTPRHLVAAY